MIVKNHVYLLILNSQSSLLKSSKSLKFLQQQQQTNTTCRRRVDVCTTVTCVPLYVRPVHTYMQATHLVHGEYRLLSPTKFTRALVRGWACTRLAHAPGWQDHTTLP